MGQIAATVLLAVRANDGLSNEALLPVQLEPTAWPASSSLHGGCGTQPVGVNVGQITPFTFTDPSRFRPDGPNPLTSNAYTEDFIETCDYGRFNSTFRTAEQTDIAYFWQAATCTGALSIWPSATGSASATCLVLRPCLHGSGRCQHCRFRDQVFLSALAAPNGDPPSRRRRQSGHRRRSDVDSAAHGEPPG